MERLIPLAALVALGGSGVFAVVVSWLHVHRPDVSPRVQGVSHYAVGSTHAAMTSAFASLSVALASAALKWLSRPDSSFAGVLLLLAALGVAVVAAVPVPVPADRSWRGPTHTVGALVFLLSAAAGSVVASRGLGEPSIQVAWTLSASVSLFLASMTGLPGLFPIRGWLQRLCFALVVLWVVTVSL